MTAWRATITTLFLAGVSLPLWAADPVILPFTVQLDGPCDARFAGIITAQVNGYYRAAGLDVTIIAGNPGSSPVVAVESHDNWVGVEEPDKLLTDCANGHQVKAFATTFQQSPLALISLTKNRVPSIYSFFHGHSKKIGLYGEEQSALDVVLYHWGMTRDDLNIIDLQNSLSPLTNGDVDAIQGSVLDVAVKLELAGHHVFTVPYSRNGFISYGAVLFTSNSTLQAHPDQLAKFLAATNRGWTAALRSPDATAKMLIKNFSSQGSVKSQALELEEIRPLLTAQDSRLGFMQPETWTQSLELFTSFDFVTKPVKLSDAVDYSILEQVYPSISPNPKVGTAHVHVKGRLTKDNG